MKFELRAPYSALNHSPNSPYLRSSCSSHVPLGLNISDNHVLMQVEGSFFHEPQKFHPIRKSEWKNLGQLCSFPGKFIFCFLVFLCAAENQQQNDFQISTSRVPTSLHKVHLQI